MRDFYLIAFSEKVSKMQISRSGGCADFNTNNKRPVIQYFAADIILLCVFTEGYSKVLNS